MSGQAPSPLLTIAQTATMLGVSAATLRRWDASGKFKARRHPLNGYRLYPRAEVIRLKRAIESGRSR